MKALLPAALCALFSAATHGASAEVRFSRDIAPVLLKRCTGCHGERSNMGEYRAHTYQSLLRKGASGTAALVPGKPAESRLFALISTQNQNARMPKSDDPLSAAQIALFRQWILDGAKFDGADPTTPLKNLLGPRQHPAAPAVYRTPAPVLSVAFAPGGNEIAVGGYHEVTLWNTATGALARRFANLPQRIHALSYSPDGRQLLAAGGTPGDYGEVTLLDAATGGGRNVLDTFNDIVLSARFSADGRRIVAGGADASVRLYDRAAGSRLWSSKVHSDWVTSVGFLADGRFVASASKDMTVKVYEADRGALYATYNGHNRQIGQYKGQDPVYAVQSVSGASLAVSAGGGKWIQIWDPVQVKAEAGDAGDMEERFARQGHTQYIPHGFTDNVFALVVRDGKVFAASADGLVRQFDLKTLKETQSYPGHADWVFALDYDPVSHRLASGDYSGQVRIWDAATGRCLISFASRPGASVPVPAGAAVGRSHGERRTVAGIAVLRMMETTGRETPAGISLPP